MGFEVKTEGRYKGRSEGVEVEVEAEVDFGGRWEWECGRRWTVRRVPAKVLGPMVKSMKRRCAALKGARGGHFEE